MSAWCEVRNHHVRVCAIAQQHRQSLLLELLRFGMHESQDHELARCRVRTPCMLECVAHRLPMSQSSCRECGDYAKDHSKCSLYVCEQAQSQKIRFEQQMERYLMQSPAGKHLSSCEVQRLCLARHYQLVALNMKESEVALTETVKRVVSVNDFPTIALHLFLHTIHKISVTDWLPESVASGVLTA